MNKLALAAAAVAALAAGPAGAASIFDTARDSEDFGTLADLLVLAGLDDALSGEGDFTVFAPTDAAFDATALDLDRLIDDPAFRPQLRDLLLYHVLDTELGVADLNGMSVVTALNGEDIAVVPNPPGLFPDQTPCPVSDILVDDGLADIAADNGVVHGIDGVLAPVSLFSNIVDIVADDDRFSTLVAAVTAAGLGGALTGEGPLTLFAPTNEAFENLPDGVLDDLLEPENVDALANILLYHVVEANAASSSLSSGDVETLAGDTVEVVVSGAGVTVNDANVTEADIIAMNGIVHVIDAVLLPPAGSPTGSVFDVVSDSEDPDFNTLADLLERAGLDETLSGDEGTLTLFAPVSAAFDELPDGVVDRLVDPVFLPQLRDVLLYHVLGSTVRAGDLADGTPVAALNGEDIAVDLDPPRLNDGANILVDEFVDVNATNGVVHGIDAVLAPASLTSNVVEIAAGDDRFSTLVAAVTAAGLADALTGEGPFTLFAPTNEAFDDLPDGVLDDLLAPENEEELVDLLLYHVVPGNALSSSLASGDLETLNGDSVEVVVSGAAGRRLQGVTVNDADVVDADIVASNGIVHAIDAVLVPPADGASSSKSTDMRSKTTKSSTSRTCKTTKSSKSKSKTTKSSKSKTGKTTKSSKSKSSKYGKHRKLSESNTSSDSCDESKKEKKGKKKKKKSSEGNKKEKKEKKKKESSEASKKEKTEKTERSEASKKNKKKMKKNKDKEKYNHHYRNRRHVGPLL